MLISSTQLETEDSNIITEEPVRRYTVSLRLLTESEITD